MKHMLCKILSGVCLVLALAVPARAANDVLETLSYPALQQMIADNKGKVIVINFFATWCPPCREEIPGLINIRKTTGEDKLILIGASVDEDEKALRDYMRKMQFNYPIQKAGDDLSQAAGVRAIPHMLVFDPQGELAANESGFVPEETLRKFIQDLLEQK